jgi:hypothetical protein
VRRACLFPLFQTEVKNAGQHHSLNDPLPKHVSLYAEAFASRQNKYFRICVFRPWDSTEYHTCSTTDEAGSGGQGAGPGWDWQVREPYMQTPRVLSKHDTTGLHVLQLALTKIFLAASATQAWSGPAE